MPGTKMVLTRPRKEKRTQFLRALKATMRKRVRGWVNYFRWGHTGSDLKFVRWQVETKVRKFASRQRPKRRGGRAWTTWSAKEIYGAWGLFHDYRVLPRSEPRPRRV
jgi:RNA-directed DNA polymerase